MELSLSDFGEAPRKRGVAPQSREAELVESRKEEELDRHAVARWPSTAGCHSPALCEVAVPPSGVWSAEAHRGPLGRAKAAPSSTWAVRCVQGSSSPVSGFSLLRVIENGTEGRTWPPSGGLHQDCAMACRRVTRLSRLSRKPHRQHFVTERTRTQSARAPAGSCFSQPLPSSLRKPRKGEGRATHSQRHLGGPRAGAMSPPRRRGR